ncbi:IS66 family transposase [Variovorax rhizosphaerae]|uniref:IS66 family transposase n=1 Tax=Variovorax rhizosphaerae TaxID=1836200 RepID=A0ABU8WZ15_9BURK
MLGLHELPPIDQAQLPPDVAAVLQRMRQQLDAKDRELERKSAEIAWRDARLDKLNLELARLKRWKFGARTEAMTAQQRALFAETLAEDEASLQAQLAALQAKLPETPEAPKDAPRRPRRQALPEHLQRVEHRHEPASTTCPNAGCGAPMQRVGEDVSEKLDIIPAQFFVHRHIYGKWACRCCQQMVQEPAEPDVVDGGIPASGLVAHTLISRFADHLPYYRQEDINARSGVHTPRSTLAAWGGAGGAALQPLYEAHRRFVLGAAVLHADETPVPLLDPGRGKTKKAYVWAYARGTLDGAAPGVIYDFCAGRGAQYPLAFLGGKEPPYAEPPWRGTLVCDQYAGYGPVLDPKVQPGRQAAGCAAHARRKFEELTTRGASASPVAVQALQRWARIYHVERLLTDSTAEERHAGRQRMSRPLWEELRAWLQLERQRVAGGAIGQALDYSLNHWEALTLHLADGAVPIDNNHLEQQIKPWKLGAKNWLFVGSELAGERAAVVMSLVQSAKLNKIEPWAYLRDVLARIHAHPASRIDELLPHRWRPR